MIGSHELEYVFPCIPKAGTLSVRKWLIKYHAGRIIRGYHAADVRDEWKDHLIFTVVRNPRERLWSWYQWELYQVRVNRPRRMKNLEPHLGSFEHFLKLLISLRGREAPQPESPQLTLTMYDYFVRAGCSRYLKLERLVPDLRALPFATEETVMQIEHTRITPGKRPLRISRAAEGLIRSYCPEDFDFFDYS